MGGSSQSSTSNTHATTNTDPWYPTIPTLKQLISNVYSNTPNDMGPNPTENAAYAQLMNNAQSNPYAPGINSLASNMLNGTSMPDRTGLLSGGYGDLQNSLSPIANQSTNPYDNQAFTNLIGTMTGDLTNSIKSQYAGAGYSPTSSGDFGQQLGRGIAQGVAPTFLQAQDALTSQRMNAANGLFAGAQGAASGLSALDQARLQSQMAGVPMAATALNATDSPYMRQLQLQNQIRNEPFQNIGSAESLIVPMAQLGGQSVQDSQTQTTSHSTPSPFSMISGLLGMGLPGGGSLGGGMGAGLFGGLFGLSDRRAKEAIEEVGKLHDGTPVYRFRYKGDPLKRVHIGLMADEVEQYAPEAVVELGGVKFVNYHLATERARRAA